LAVTLDDTLAEGHAALAFNLWRYQWDFSAAEREFRKALEVDPNYANAHHWYGLYLASRGRFNEARTELSQAPAVDPLSLIIMTNSGWIDYFARDFDAAVTKYREATSISPDFIPAIVKTSWAYEQKAMWKESADARERFYRQSGIRLYRTKFSVRMPKPVILRYCNCFWGKPESQTGSSITTNTRRLE
jgi:Tfp pilus assembly protein PilF